jgi:DNA-directed RNA polymerase alpha subunit
VAFINTTIVTMKESSAEYSLPVKLAKPAQRALQNAGITTLKQLSKLSEQEVAKLHGIGKNAIQQISKTLADNGLSFAQMKK